MGLGRSSMRYRSRGRDRNGHLRQRLRELAAQRQRFGYRRLLALLRREGMQVNHKRVHRIYREEGLALRRRRRKRWVRKDGQAPALPTRPNERWSMDFVTDRLATGQTLRILVIVDDYTRECLALEADTSISGARVVRVLEAIMRERGRPGSIVLDNGPEFRGRAMETWSEQRGVPLRFIEPGKPVQNAYAESFNGRLRDECLNANWFLNVADARRKLAGWRTDYNEVRPHSGLGYVAPGEFAARIRGSLPC
jgi:putative transposase